MSTKVTRHSAESSRGHLSSPVFKHFFLNEHLQCVFIVLRILCTQEPFAVNRFTWLLNIRQKDKSRHFRTHKKCLNKSLLYESIYCLTALFIPTYFHISVVLISRCHSAYSAIRQEENSFHVKKATVKITVGLRPTL